VSKKFENKLTVEITEKHAENVAWLFSLSKAFSSPVRLAVVGLLAANLKDTFSVTDIAQSLEIKPEQLEKDLGQLCEAGIILAVKEGIPEGERNPQIISVRFNLAYLAKIPNAVATMSHINNQIHPKESEPQDERAKFIQTFFKGKELLAFPTQFKRQVWAMEEISHAFSSEQEYTERAVDTILKEVYPEDHCTLRRFLVDLGYLTRENGIYRKVIK
jgi:hypothetical protein